MSAFSHATSRSTRVRLKAAPPNCSRWRRLPLEASAARCPSVVRPHVLRRICRILHGQVGVLAAVVPRPTQSRGFRSRTRVSPLVWQAACATCARMRCFDKTRRDQHIPQRDRAPRSTWMMSGFGLCGCSGPRRHTTTSRRSSNSNNKHKHNSRRSSSSSMPRTIINSRCALTSPPQRS